MNEPLRSTPGSKAYQGRDFRRIHQESCFRWGKSANPKYLGRGDESSKSAGRKPQIRKSQVWRNTAFVYKQVLIRPVSCFLKVVGIRWVNRIKGGQYI